MLLKSLQYFWLRFWGASRDDHRIRICGETYWLYRLYAESAVFVVLYLALFGTLFITEPPELPLFNRIGLACVFAVIGWTEWMRLRIELREQREFAAQFYG
jgi:hypothetical protein